MLYIYRAACHVDVPLRVAPEGYLLDGAANCGIPDGAPITNLLVACQTCPKHAPVTALTANTGKEQGRTMVDENSKTPLPQPQLPSSVPALPPGLPTTSGGVALVLSNLPPGSGVGAGPVVAAVQPRPEMQAPSASASPVQSQVQVNLPQAVMPIQTVGFTSPQASPFTPAGALARSQPESMSHIGTPESALLTSMLVGIGGEELVDVNATLAKIPGLAGGPSEGGFSWHTLETCMRCWRLAYYTLALGLVAKQTPRPLSFGSLYHACWEIWYKSGGQRRYDEPCDAVRQAGAPKLAGEVQRLVYIELMKYAAQEANEWDLRAIEQNAVFWGEPERISGRLVYLPLSCRHDALIAKRAPGAPCAPPGPVATGIHIVDRKTSSALTYDLTKGYAMDGQFLMNALVYTRSDEAEAYGPLIGMIFSVAVKHKEPTPEKSYFRVETTVEDRTLEEFYRTEIRPYTIELYRRLSSEEYRSPNLWFKNRAACVGRYGCCRYFDICDVGGESIMDAMFTVDPSAAFDLRKLADPPAAVKRAVRVANPEKRASEEVRKQHGEEKKRYGTMLLEAFRAAAVTMEAFSSKLYLVPNHTPKGVLEKLSAALSNSWEVNLTFPFGPDGAGNHYEMCVGVKGLDWKLKVEESVEQAIGSETGKSKTKKRQPGVKGKLTWKVIAEAICRDWWDLKNLDPKGM